jgi:hypothetical protein
MPLIGEYVNEEAIQSFIEAANKNGYQRIGRPDGDASEELTIHNIDPYKDDKNVHKEIADNVVDGFAVSDNWVAGRVTGESPTSITVYVRKPCEECTNRPVQTEDGICNKCHPDKTDLR